MKANFLFTVIFNVLINSLSYSQTFAELNGSALFSDFKLDTTYKNPLGSKFIPKKRDSLFLYEYILLTKSEKTWTQKQYSNLINEYSKRIFIDYTEKLSNGTVSSDDFQDFIFERDDELNIYLTYERLLHRNFYKKRNQIYYLEYVATWPKGWLGRQKWEYSEQHFIEKIKEIKLLFNTCH
jgi:hypothetical protein